jgi:hypothetical protein
MTNAPQTTSHQIFIFPFGPSRASKRAAREDAHECAGLNPGSTVVYNIDWLAYEVHATA